MLRIADSHSAEECQQNMVQLDNTALQNLPGLHCPAHPARPAGMHLRCSHNSYKHTQQLTRFCWITPPPCCLGMAQV